VAPPARTEVPPAVTEGDVETRKIPYKDGDTELEGHLAWDESLGGKRPGVLVVHDWMGISAETERRCAMLAELGYVALAADVYGKGVRPSSREQAVALAGTYRGDRALFRHRLQVALEELKRQPLVDRDRCAVIGYCFGGTGAMELARAGADLEGVVSFHGGLDSLHPEDARSIKAKVLVLHGADDPTMSPEQVAAFQNELREACVDWQMVYYGGAVHSFTNPGAGSDKSRGVAYDARADRRSWQAMRAFFGEIFA
jgi:dienelactone hydrolase